jgi:hypothetical protein
MLLAGCTFDPPKHFNAIRYSPKEGVMATWQILRRPPNSGPQQVITMSDEVSELLTFDRAPDGNCLEARFLAKDIGIRARDLVTLQVNVGSGFTNVFTGYAESPGAVNNDTDVAQFILVGFKQRFQEIEFEEAVLTRGDVGAMVRAIVSQSKYLPPGVSYNAAYVPNTGFSLGDRFYSAESLKEIFDALVSSLSGYSWGVDANGLFFFRPIGTETNTFVHGTDSTKIDFEAVNAAEVVTAVTLELPPVNLEGLVAKTYTAAVGSQVNVSSLVNPAFYIRNEDQTAHSLYQAWKKIPWPGGMPPYNLVGSGYASSSPLIQNIANLSDTNANTFANFNYNGFTPSRADYYLIASLELTTGDYIDGFEFDYETDIDLRLDLIVEWDGGISRDTNYTTFEFPKASQRRRRQVSIVPRDVRFDEEKTGGVKRAVVELYGFVPPSGLTTNSLKVYTMQMLRLDRPKLLSLASSYFVTLKQEAAKVTRTGEYLLTPRPDVNLTKGSLFLQRKAARYSVSITKDGGVQNTVMISQPTDSDLISENYANQVQRTVAIRNENRLVR